MRESKILDQYGNPISVKELEQLQTSKVGWLPREFAEHPTSGLTPARLAALLIEAERGDLKSLSELGNDLERKDYQIFSEASKRKEQVASFTWDLVVPKKATSQIKNLAEELKDQIDRIGDLEDVTKDMMDGLLKGFSNLELKWNYHNHEWLPEIMHRPATWFTVDQQNRDSILLRNAGVGEPLTPFGWIQHRHKSMSGYITQSNLTYVLAWPFLFKNYAYRDLAELLEIYGLPIGIGKYPSGAKDTEKNTLLRALTSIGRNARGIIPEGMSIDFENAGDGKADPFNLMIEKCDHAISKCLVGGTLTSDSSGGTKTNALGNVHERAFWSIGVSDSKQLQSSYSRYLVYPLAVLNGRVPVQINEIRWRFDVEGDTEDKEFLETVTALVNAGAGAYIPISHVLDKVRIPLATEGEPTFDKPATATPPEPPQPEPEAKEDEEKDQAEGEEKTSYQAVLKKQTEDDIEALAETLAEEWEEVTGPVINPFLDLLNNCTSIEEFKRRMPEALKQTNTRNAQTSLANAMFTAYLSGRLNAD